MATLAALPNGYGGIHVDPERLPLTPDAFAAALQTSIDAWRGEQVKVIWLELSAGLADLLPAALAQGFRFHHCSDTTLVLTNRLSTAAAVPDPATHGIGVGGVVLAADGSLLTVLENQDAVDHPERFKLPGGMLAPGEHLADGIVREVREETGIDAVCEGLVSLRHHHRGQFGSSNIYAVFRLRARSQQLTPDPEEIAVARWVPVEEYLASPGVGAFNRHVVRLAVSRDPLPSVKLPGYMDSPLVYEIY